MTTTIPEVNRIERRWLLVDAKDQVLGRLASRIAHVLRGKHKVTFTPFLDTGDFVVVVNADKVAVTGQKRSQKIYQRYSGYPGGRRTRTLEDVLRTHPERVLQQAVKGMMPDGPLGRRLLSKLKIYAGPAHPHGAQQPQPVQLLPARGAGSTHG
ncbi:MAG: 50S ribosomal protein L13 [Candidatus Omnitrophica bacterium]|nr:50S ribosomal protein L13 [Candidatus Omnitrophota bacterium]MBI3020887.1 50S ribosomal protein L13 [Candidatus Omnitrophota bacterium]